MYGLVNKAIRELVIEVSNEDTWDKICENIDFFEGDFVAMYPYEDKLTYDLVEETSKVLNKDANEVLLIFGKYWIDYTRKSKYGDLLDFENKSFVEIINSLDFLHDRIKDMMPDLNPPKFNAESVSDRKLKLQYESHRDGMLPMLHGLILGIGELYNLDLHFEVLKEMTESDRKAIVEISW